MTNGGDAELELIDSLDPFSEGVVFSVRPPKKSWKQMLKLSGINIFLKFRRRKNIIFVGIGVCTALF